ncbi:MAG: UbiD family decarboxylase [Planctomycetota bacterium]|jgi:4-hydroxy-3-polyprenylbenzoate decarboxylase|nr:UbiD family decarboxylase [Planctomycetota bacterium]MDP7133262.1 UbiD family decarboxylase [Planctomycetota bacterium]MDP7253142.1 UbiD family decarboxylase [Planctomycetota bacterium]
MGYKSLKECVDDLEREGQLVRIEQEVDPYLEAAEIQRQVFQAGGPAIFYAKVKGCRFPMVSNVFGTMDRVRFILRDTLDAVEKLMRLKADPAAPLKKPLTYLAAGLKGLSGLPKKVRSGPVMQNECRIEDLPHIQSWPDDGGAFFLLPQVYTENANKPGVMGSNLGMYRIQMSGGEYEKNREIGLHYQIHRGIGVHHSAAIEKGIPFRVSIFLGAPAMTMAAVMPLPEGMPEVCFAGALGGRRIRMSRSDDGPVHVDADFCITGVVDPEKKLPEGPFGDHLGYYSLAHDYPVLRVEKVYHRSDAIWPFTVVGRPPQEDTMFCKIIHELTGDVIPAVLPGVHAIHAVDAAGVHPLLLALGSERYVPFEKRARPQELLTQANAILGQGQMSLAKYLMIGSVQDNPDLDVEDIEAFLRHILERVDWKRDLHFQTCTTIDTLDYSGTGLNEGSKVVVAAVGPKRRDLPYEITDELKLPEGFSNPRVCFPGVLAVEGPTPEAEGSGEAEVARFAEAFESDALINTFPLIVIVDDSDFTAKTLNNFLWVTFTRSNPASDIYGIDSETESKHWGCRGSLVIDSRSKPHHAPPLVEDPGVTRRVDALGAKGGPLFGII